MLVGWEGSHSSRPRATAWAWITLGTFLWLPLTQKQGEHLAIRQLGKLCAQWYSLPFGNEHITLRTMLKFLAKLLNLVRYLGVQCINSSGREAEELTMLRVIWVVTSDQLWRQVRLEWDFAGSVQSKPTALSMSWPKSSCWFCQKFSIFCERTIGAEKMVQRAGTQQAFQAGSLGMTPGHGT